MTEQHSAENCKNCEFPLDHDDLYCRRCGQKVVDANDRSFKHLLLSSFEEVTSLDSRLWRSTRYLLTRPGHLSYEYRVGRRAQYHSPISLFLIANLIFFLIPSLSDFNITLYDQVKLQPYSSWIAPWIEQFVSDSGLTFKQLASDYQIKVIEIAKTMVILHVPLFALVSFALAPRFYFADHVVMSMHFFAFIMWYFVLMPYTIEPFLELMDLLIPFWDINTWSIALALKFLYLPFMFKKAFEFSWLRTILHSVVCLFALYWCHVIYRFVQFWVVVGTMNYSS